MREDISHEANNSRQDEVEENERGRWLFQHRLRRLLIDFYSIQSCRHCVNSLSKSKEGRKEGKSGRMIFSFSFYIS
jgi:hypothetical protein